MFNFRTYEIMLKGLIGEGEIMNACVLSEKMLDKFHCRQCETFDEVIFGLGQKGLVCNAKELMQKIIGKNVTLGLWPRKPCFLVLDLNLAFQRLF